MQRRLVVGLRVHALGRGVRVLLLERLDGDLRRHSHPIGVATVDLDGARIAEHRQRVRDLLDPDFLLERGVVGVIGRDPKPADPADHLMLGGVGVDVHRARLILNLPDDAVVNVAQLRVAVAVDRARLNGEVGLPDIVGDLTHELRQPVERQHRPPVGLALLAHFRRPLVSSRKRHIGRSLTAIVAVEVPRLLDAVARLLDHVLRLAVWLGGLGVVAGSRHYGHQKLAAFSALISRT